MTPWLSLLNSQQDSETINPFSPDFHLHPALPTSLDPLNPFRPYAPAIDLTEYRSGPQGLLGGITAFIQHIFGQGNSDSHQKESDDLFALRDRSGRLIAKQPTAPRASSPHPPAVNTTPQSTPQGSLDTSSPSAFIRSLLPFARVAAQQSGIPVEVFLAIPANETGWGRAGTSLFGIKGSGTAGSYASPTWEVVNGRVVNTTDTFAAYRNPLEAMQAFANLVSTAPRYQQAMAALRSGDVLGFLRGLQRGGYATDPTWGDKIYSLINQVHRYLGG